MKETLRELTGEEVEALQVFANKNGRCWKQELSRLWLSGQIDMPLYGLRNTHGGSWLEKLELPPAPAAANLYEFVEKYGVHGVPEREGFRGWKARLRLPFNEKEVLLHHPSGLGRMGLPPKLANFLRVALKSEDFGLEKSLKKFLGALYEEALTCAKEAF